MTTATDETRVTRKVRHALASWIEKDAQGREVTVTAYRGQIIDLPADEAARLERYDALIPAEGDLERPGKLMALPEEVGDEELINWVLQASPEEIAAVAKDRPELAPRLSGAAARIVNERKRQDEHLANVQRALAGLPPAEPLNRDVTPDGPLAISDDILLADGEAAAIRAATGTDTVELPPDQDRITDGYIRQPATGGADEADDDLGTDAATTPADADDDGSDIVLGAAALTPPPDFTDIVEGNVDDVSAYLSDHPEFAAHVLAAETERAGRLGKEPRAGVRRAVEVAAAYGAG